MGTLQDWYRVGRSATGLEDWWERYRVGGQGRIRDYGGGGAQGHMEAENFAALRAELFLYQSLH